MSLLISDVSDDAALLSKIITAECSICPVEEQYLVGSVVLNRVDHEKFPHNIHDVLEQEGQFHGYNSQWFVSTATSLRVAKDLLKGKNRDTTILYFYRRDAKNQKFVNKMDKFVKYTKKFHNYAVEPNI